MLRYIILPYTSVIVAILKIYSRVVTELTTVTITGTPGQSRCQSFAYCALGHRWCILAIQLAVVRHLYLREKLIISLAVSFKIKVCISSTSFEKISKSYSQDFS